MPEYLTVPKPDLILCWPDTIDFPLFRKWLGEEKDSFEKIIIVFTETNWGEVISPEIQRELKNSQTIFINNGVAPSGEDWRNVAVNKALKESTAKWVFFTEQDFFPLKGFWDVVESNLIMDDVNAFGAYVDDRLHPCCIFAKREAIDKTSKDFSANPEAGYDHFGKFQKELMEQGPVPKIKSDLYYHMAGLTHNLYLVSKGEPPVYKPEEFESYLKLVEKYENFS